MTKQTPALLVQRALWTRTAVMLLQSLYFFLSPSPGAIIPDARPLSTFENQDGRHSESRKNKGTVNSLLPLACFPLFSLLTLYSFARFLRHVSLVQFIKQGFLGRTDTLLQSYFIKLPWENKVFSFTHSLTTFFPWTTEQTHGNMDSFRFMQWTAEKKKTDKLASPYRLIVPDWSFSKSCWNATFRLCFLILFFLIKALMTHSE